MPGRAVSASPAARCMAYGVSSSSAGADRGERRGRGGAGSAGGARYAGRAGRLGTTTSANRARGRRWRREGIDRRRRGAGAGGDRPRRRASWSTPRARRMIVDPARQAGRDGAGPADPDRAGARTCRCGAEPTTDFRELVGGRCARRRRRRGIPRVVDARHARRSQDDRAALPPRRT